ncbi:GNAT family N-acetyltransferase [Marmoricola sp. RAF53]|uniref:GNAT family N-acetyltransferase n=1 Tax=Marmoricola sp. RAF53 TaxID=3233059 RepID=UPI003F9DA160
MRLRAVEDQDLEVFFDHQADPLAVEMAAFPARGRDQFAAHWAKVRADETLVTRTVVADGRVAGYIGSWPQDGQQLLGYWIGREFWGRGVATRALALLVDEVRVRPLHAQVAAHNAGSIRVLEKCGFRRDPVQEAGAAAPADGIEELVFVLPAAAVFTMSQIDDIHARLGRADSVAAYLRALAEIGVVRFDSFVTDGHSEYVDAAGGRVVSAAHHPVLRIAGTSDRDAFLEHLRLHADGRTSYVEMSEGLAASGIEKWVADTALLTMTYVDRAGRALLVQHLE